MIINQKIICRIYIINKLRVEYDEDNYNKLT